MCRRAAARVRKTLTATRPEIADFCDLSRAGCERLIDERFLKATASP